MTLKSAWFMSHRIREAMRKGAAPSADGWRASAHCRGRRNLHRPQVARPRRGGMHHKNAVLDPD